MANWRFGAFPKLPYSTMQQLNLDWILDRIRRFLPDNGTKGQVLTRTKDGAAWVDPEAASGAVSSVNGKTGAVVLTASDVGALPSSYQAPVTSVNGMTGDVVISGGGAVDSVNGKTGEVVLTAADVGALPSSTVIPDSTSDLINDSGFITAAQAAAAAPVQSVNGQTGDVVIQTGGSPLDAYPVGSIYMSVNSTSPATLFGGTWEQLEDRFLLAAGQTYTAGDTGGEAEHTLVKAELPAEQYRVGQDMSALGIQETWYLTYANGPAPAANAGAKIHNSPIGAWAMTEPLGSGQAHNNMPPYLAVYMWKRTA